MNNNYLFCGLNSAYMLNERLEELIDMPVAEFQSEKFSDGEVHVKFGKSIRGKSLFILSQAHMPYENIFELYLAVDAARRASVREIICIIPYLPHSRQERKDAERTSIAARLVGDFLQFAGASRLVTVELHANTIEGFYNIPIDHLKTTRMMVNKVKELYPKNDIVLVSPDFGGLKRIKAYKDLLNCDIAVINKERLKPNQVESMELIGEVKDKNVILIDDMIDTAGTICEAADLCIEKGAKSAVALATHGLFSGEALEKIADSALEKVYITDTVPFTRANPKIEVISTVTLIAEAMKAIMENDSIKELNQKE